jgi:hypothetical protein
MRQGFPPDACAKVYRKTIRPFFCAFRVNNHPPGRSRSAKKMPICNNGKSFWKAKLLTLITIHKLKGNL